MNPSGNYDRDKDYDRTRKSYCREFVRAILQSMDSSRRRSKALDVGTGTGIFAFNLDGHFDRVIGVDPSEERIRIAKQLARNRKSRFVFKVGAVENLPIDEGGFNLITAAQCFQYFDARKAIPILHERLCPNGTLAVFWKYMSPSSRYTRLANRVVDRMNAKSGLDLLRRESMEQFLRDAFPYELMRKSGFQEIVFRCIKSSYLFSRTDWLNYLCGHALVRTELTAEAQSRLKDALTQELERAKVSTGIWETFDHFLFLARK